jgi:purine nucleoside phosphorylase
VRSPEGTPLSGAALRRVAAFGAHAAVVFGSGLAALPPGAAVVAELGYAELGWPCTAVPGHANLLRLVTVPAPGEGRAPLRLALACGRPHHYEGWSEAELRRPVAGLAEAGVRRVLLTNSCGALSVGEAGDMVACHAITDLQAPPAQPGGAPRLCVCTASQAAGLAAAVQPFAAAGGAQARAGVYVAVAGPQYETPAEVAWLAGYGDVVGMSAAPEVRAAQAAGAGCALLGLVANRAGAAGCHEAVLRAGALMAQALAAALPAALAARWPELHTTTDQGAAWTS